MLRLVDTVAKNEQTGSSFVVTSENTGETIKSIRNVRSDDIRCAHERMIWNEYGSKKCLYLKDYRTNPEKNNVL